jgi:hypothetical protein
MKITLLFSLLSCITFGQAKFEVQEISGKVLSIQPGYGFAYEVVELQVGDENWKFKIDPGFGKRVFSKIVIGEMLTLKANINLTAHENANWKSFSSKYAYHFADQALEVKLNGTWVSTASKEKTAVNSAKGIFLEQKVLDDFKYGGVRRGFIFGDRKVAFSVYSPLLNSMEGAAPGKIVSFIGYQTPVKDGYLYPIEDVRDVYSYVPLAKEVGVIQSFIYKQNYVRIGLVINQKRLSFPADYAEKIQVLANGKDVTVYFDKHAEPTTHNLLPTVHAIIQERDTILIPSFYYGDPDGKHEHKLTELIGKIVKVNRTNNGRITSLIIGNDGYVEVDPKMAQQLGSYLTKGKELKIIGEERIKKEGEIYEKNFRIITPRKVIANGKEFILNE